MSRYDLPLPGAPRIETKSGSISSMARGIGRWHRGQARVRQVIPLESIASPSIVNRLGKNRCCCSGPSKGSPSRSICSEIHNTCSGANRSQQWGHVTCESSLIAVPAAPAIDASVPTALAIAITTIDQEGLETRHPRRRSSCKIESRADFGHDASIHLLKRAMRRVYQ